MSSYQIKHVGYCILFLFSLKAVKVIKEEFYCLKITKQTNIGKLVLNI